MASSTNYLGTLFQTLTPSTVTNRAPIATDDSSAGYRASSTWLNTATNTAYVCADETAGAAVWIVSSINLPGTATTALTDNTGGAATNTLAAVTAPASLTNNIGGTPSTTLAAVTNIANVGSADVGPVANGMNQLAVNVIADRAAIVSLTNAAASLAAKVDVIITALKAAGILS